MVRKRTANWMNEEYRNKTKDRIKASMRKSYLKKKYKLSVEAYNLLLARQKGTCAICEKPSENRRLSVDHSHKTDKVRGLLCIRCNMLLGYALDNIFTLVRAIAYLQSDEK